MKGIATNCGSGATGSRTARASGRCPLGGTIRGDGATFARAMPRDRTDQPPGNTINSPTIDGWWTPQRNLNTPALSAVNVTVVSWPRLTVKLIS
jgi:hypothetical protein